VRRILTVGLVAGVLAASGLFTACEGLGPDDLAGRYVLTYAQGEEVPTTVEVGELIFDLIGGWWQLNSDRTWSSHLETDQDISDDSGTYENDGEIVTFSNDTQFETIGTIDGDRLIVAEGELVLIFVR